MLSTKDFIKDEYFQLKKIDGGGKNKTIQNET